jgi:ethanolamine utilization microcompartment shell protein EutS
MMIAEFEATEKERKDRREALLKEYGEVSGNFRTLTDIRFRLLSLLPAAAAVAAAFKPEGGAPGRLPFAIFGLTVTIGLVTYNKRNDQLYNELVNRAAAIERELGLPDGAFATRPNAWLEFRSLTLRWDVSHGRAVYTVYLATVAFWLFLALEAVSVLAAQTPAGKLVLAHLLAQIGEDWRASIGILARGILVLVAILVTMAAGALIAMREATRAASVRHSVRQATKMLMAAERALMQRLSHEGQHSNSFGLPASVRLRGQTAGRGIPIGRQA